MSKKIIIAISIVAVVIIAGFYYLKFRKSTDFEPLIKAKLQELVRDASDSLYVLDIDKIEIDVFKSKVTVRKASLMVDSARYRVLDTRGTLPVDVYRMSFSGLVIDGFNVDDLLKKKNIDLEALHIVHPTVEIYHPVGKNNEYSKDTSTLYSRIAKSVGHFRIKDLAITKMDFMYHNIAHKEKLTAFNDVSMKFSDIEIDSLTQYDTTRFLYAKGAWIYLTNYSFRTADSLYFINADSLTINAARKEINIKGIALEPRYSKTEFGKKLKFYKDRYNIKFATADFRDVDWYHLFLGEGFAAKQAVFDSGTMEVFADKNVPPSPKSKVGNYPHQLLMRLDFPVNIDTVRIKNFRFTYRELNAKTQKTGEVSWTDIDGTITNITNISEKIAENKILKVAAQSKLLNAGRFDVVFGFDLTQTAAGNFTVDIDLGPMNGEAVNTASKTLGMFEVNSLKIKKLKAHIIANNNNARSSVLFVYDDLKITALKKDEDSKQLKKRKFLSFFANTFVLNKSNEINDAQPKYVSYNRDPQRSFFSLIWKSLLKGITSTASE